MKNKMLAMAVFHPNKKLLTLRVIYLWNLSLGIHSQLSACGQY